eukprot:TRINITY_DN1178_c0_g1_i1.p1 TRINITY_DN1178_c0_g1~~TRINITY_DN1178_c0_g1_i1.p1  ORF type:complete len:241 (+),score=55.64 TRINITY_DN1178_c0_g1_i1:45-767(+)
MRVLLVSIFLLCLFAPAACTQSNDQFLAAADRELGELAQVVNEGGDVANDEEDMADGALAHAQEDDEEDDDEDSTHLAAVEDEQRPVIMPKGTGYKVAKANLNLALAKLKQYKFKLIAVLTKMSKKKCARKWRCLLKKGKYEKLVKASEKDVAEKRLKFNTAFGAEVNKNELIYQKKYPPLWQAKRQLKIAKFNKKLLDAKKTCDAKCIVEKKKWGLQVSEFKRKIRGIRIMINKVKASR